MYKILLLKKPQNKSVLLYIQHNSILGAQHNLFHTSTHFGCYLQTKQVLFLFKKKSLSQKVEARKKIGGK